MSDQIDDKDSASALDRYLKRQAGTAPSPAPETRDNPAAPEAPAFAPGSGSGPGIDLNISAQPSGQYEPAGFWRRAGAAMVDGVILSILKSVVTVPVAIVLGVFFRNGPAAELSLAGNLFNGLISLGLALLGVYFYYGWFYFNKGATPGKMIFDLKVLDARTGTYLDYRRTLGRELFGKLLSGITFGIGFIMAGFTEDKRALHDMVCSTRVVKIKKV